jgi:polyhydroxyalkanoate synthesis regulator phasin
MDGQGAKTEVEVLRGGIDELKRDKADLRNLVELLKNELARTKDETVCEVAKAKTEGEARVRGLTAEYGVELGELRNKVDELEKALREKEERVRFH